MKASFLKKMVLLGFVALAAQVKAAADDARAVRQLQEKIGQDSLIPLTASRQEIALALADVAATSGQPQADLTGWNSKDYDALFALLQQYREELGALGLKQAAVDAALDALRKRVADLEERMEYLPPDGMKIHGGFNILVDDLLITGPGQYLGKPTRFRHFKQYVDLEFTAIHGPFLGITQVDLANYVGSYAAPEPLGIRRAYAELRTPIAMQTGDFNIKYTPLTLWRNEDEDPYSPEPFRGRSVRLRDDLLLEDDHAAALRGLRILTDLVLSETRALELETYLAVLNGPGQVAYTTAVRTTGLDKDTYKTLYTTFLGAWKMATEPLHGWRVGYVGVKMWDDKDTNNLIYNKDIGTLLPSASDKIGRSVDGFDSQVHSFNTSLSAFDGLLDAQAEYAMSLYSNPNVGYFAEGLTSTPGTPNYFGNADFRGGAYIPGTSMNASMTLGPKWAKLTGSFFQTGESFVAPAAQTRTLDRNRTPFGPFYTENSQLNPSGGYGNFSGFPFVDYPETQLNRRIVQPMSLLANTHPTFNYLVPYDVGWEASLPYGLATPNRSGYSSELAFNFLNGGFKPEVKVQISQQVEGEGHMLNVTGQQVTGTVRPPEKYLMARAGMTIDLKPMLNWPVKFTAGYRIESMDADAPWAPAVAPNITFTAGLPPAQVNFDSTRLDLGIEYYPVKTTGFFLGYRHLDYNGIVYDPDTTYRPRGELSYQENYESTGVGMRHFMGGDRIVIDLLYSNQTYPDRNLALTKGLVVAYEMEQLYSKISVRF